MAYYKDGEFRSDPWVSLDRLVIDATDWQERRENVLPEHVGLVVDPGFMLETLADDIGRFGLIKIKFPKFTDGRGYSLGWLLRSHLGYRGEMRATGDVLFDEMQFMTRCGFDAFEIEDAETMRLLTEGRRNAIDRFYQPGLEAEIPEGTRPWARRAAPKAGTLSS
jgi:uncharacterized protein (DUF934 family)